MQDETIIRDLNYKCRTYDGLNKLLVSTKNRLHHLMVEADAKHQDEVQAMESIKGKLSRQIQKLCEFWPVWSEWMADISGIGPYIAGNLILLYYVRFLPICKTCFSDLVKQEGTFVCSACGSKTKGEGILSTRIEEKDFPTISAWKHYMGCHTVEGRKPKRQKGVLCTWSQRGRAIAFQVGESFVKQPGDHLYRRYYQERRERRESTHPDASKQWKHNMARNETGNMFLSHFWLVARELDGKETRSPWVLEYGGHTKFIPPFYWNGSQK